ncbi:MAG: GlcG/HbpS family heme-binding protein [Planctomycetota bacterium]
MDGVQTGSIEVAIRKAKTAVAFKRPTRLFEQAVADGRTVLVALPNGMPFEGGVPITVGDEVIGAVGVSGVTAQQDGMIALHQLGVVHPHDEERRILRPALLDIDQKRPVEVKMSGLLYPGRSYSGRSACNCL